MSNEAKLFSGERNAVLLKKKFSQDHACTFNLFYYPFDTQVHWLAKTWIYLTPYVIRLYWTNFWLPTVHVQHNIFEKPFLQKLVAHIVMLLLAPFSFKFVNHSRHSETLNFWKNPNSTSFSFDCSNLTIFKHTSKTHCASNNWPILTQKVPKEG